MLSFLSNLGKRVDLVCVFCCPSAEPIAQVPTLYVSPAMSVVEYVNVFSSTIDATANVPLYPLLSIAVVLVLLIAFLTIISSPTDRLWGLSDLTVTISLTLSKSNVDINL